MSTTRTWKRIELRRSGRFWLLATALMVTGAARPSTAVVGAQPPAAILVYPEIRFDSSQGQDTLIELANTRADAPVSVLCIYLNALGHCSASLLACQDDTQCNPGENCMNQCTESNFLFQMTPGQVIGWPASAGLNPFPLFEGSQIIPVATHPFLGEMKCVELSNSTDTPPSVPVARNDLIGTATLVSTNGPDVASYTAIGIPAVGPNNSDGVLCLGSDGSAQCPTAEYASCPAALSLNHFSNNAAVDSTHVQTSLVLVPCSEDFEHLQPPTVRVSFSVFDEFEVPLSFSTTITCWGSIPFQSVPTLNLVSTIGVQMRLQGMSAAGALMPLLGVGVETYNGTSSNPHQAAHNLTAVGRSPQADIINLPPTP